MITNYQVILTDAPNMQSQVFEFGTDRKEADEFFDRLTFFFHPRQGEFIVEFQEIKIEQVMED